MRTAYVDGRYTPLAAATVNIEDRGLQFSDGVYEVAAVLNRRLLDWEPHVARLRRSLGELDMAAPMGDAALSLVARRLIAANRATDALLYVQVTRGAAKRDHLFPSGAISSLMMTVRPFDFAGRKRAVGGGVAVVTLPDERWARPDIKSVCLLANVLGKERARRAGAAEAWFVDAHGHITDGGSTNAWIVDADGRLRTRAADGSILAGVMRAALLATAASLQLAVAETPFTPAEAAGAREAFLTSTTNPCVPVVTIDGRPVGDGTPGPISRRLAGELWAEIERQTGWSG